MSDELRLPIEIGKVYQRRDGTLVPAREKHPDYSANIAYVGDGTLASPLGHEHVFLDSGRVSSSEVSVHDSSFDLVAGPIEDEEESVAPQPGPHPHADILRAIADGEQVQQLIGATWMDVAVKGALSTIAMGGISVFRRKPKTLLIGSIEVPEPMRVAPISGSIYWIPSFTDDCLALSPTWHGDGYDRRVLANGIVHATREAAEQHARALLSFTENKQ